MTDKSDKGLFLKFVIDGPPKGKARPRMMKTGHCFTPKDTVLYENLVRISFRQAATQFFTPLDGIPVSCVIQAYFPIPKSRAKNTKGGDPYLGKPDGDNIAKIICDGLNGHAWADDKCITDLHVQKFYTDKNPRVIVMVFWSESSSS